MMKFSKKYSQIFSQNILNDGDINSYKKIFKHQEACEWKKANKYILEIENNILMGHVFVSALSSSKMLSLRILGTV